MITYSPYTFREILRHIAYDVIIHNRYQVTTPYIIVLPGRVLGMIRYIEIPRITHTMLAIKTPGSCEKEKKNTLKYKRKAREVSWGK